MQAHSAELKPLLYLRNLLNDLLEKPERYVVTSDEIPELHAAAGTINEILHRVRKMSP